ncbi:hypothetical protein SAMN06272737_10595 [Blastococcus mobilis]|uniref:Uncharacterized protein n=1 Tax=Blastococcus mobilis TaxID=1938746 RepID=A0A238VWL9_9ACTN|nr:hypothetical protein SAMN06272737_10595 [Blastococcus mobilis]
MASTPNAVEDPIEPDESQRQEEGGPTWLSHRWAAVRATGEAGMSTAEYAVSSVTRNRSSQAPYLRKRPCGRTVRCLTMPPDGPLSRVQFGYSPGTSRRVRGRRR